MIQEAGNNFGFDVVARIRREVEREKEREGPEGPHSPARTQTATVGFSADGIGTEGADREQEEGLRLRALESSEAATELEALLSAALPKADQDRRSHIMKGLLIEELTVSRLRAMAKRSLVVLDHALGADNMRVQMVAGERFSIIDAISRTAGVSAEITEVTHVNGSAFGCGQPRDVARCWEGDVRGAIEAGRGDYVQARVKQTDERLEGLKALLLGNVITPEEHDAQRAAVIAAL